MRLLADCELAANSTISQKHWPLSLTIVSLTVIGVDVTAGRSSSRYAAD